ncbi:YybH family protein [Roseovarius aestuariivivens]|uniref:YybH family protein n=1 Tax=Roseovarius aestuariivivens TaxID=1888910 RepID=UPI00107FD554|nr:SgcJ/EcaC family oxidoreductase [Roseovarius aestuariivivens]
MKHHHIAYVVLSAGLMAPAALADTASEIAARSATFEAAFNSGDAAGVAAHYTEDAVILAPDTDRIDGREAIAGLWQAFIDAGVVDLDLVTTEIEAMGETANEIGAYTLKAPDGNGGMVEAAGKYIVIWRRGADDQWYLDWDIWNSNP